MSNCGQSKPCGCAPKTPCGCAQTTNTVPIAGSCEDTISRIPIAMEWCSSAAKSKLDLLKVCAAREAAEHLGELVAVETQENALLTTQNTLIQTILTSIGNLKLTDVVRNQSLNSVAGDFVITVDAGGNSTTKAFDTAVGNILLAGGGIILSGGKISVDCAKVVSCMSSIIASIDARLDSLESATSPGNLCAAITPCINNNVDPKIAGVRGGLGFSLQDTASGCNLRQVVVDSIGQLRVVNPTASFVASIIVDTTNVFIASDRITNPLGTFLGSCNFNSTCPNEVYRFDIGAAYEVKVSPIGFTHLVLVLDGSIILDGAGLPAAYNGSSNFTGPQSSTGQIGVGAAGNHTLEAYFTDDGDNSKLYTGLSVPFRIILNRF